MDACRFKLRLQRRLYRHHHCRRDPIEALSGRLTLRLARQWFVEPRGSKTDVPFPLSAGRSDTTFADVISSRDQHGFPDTIVFPGTDIEEDVVTSCLVRSRSTKICIICTRAGPKIASPYAKVNSLFQGETVWSDMPSFQASCFASCHARVWLVRPRPASRSASPSVGVQAARLRAPLKHILGELPPFQFRMRASTIPNDSKNPAPTTGSQRNGMEAAFGSQYPSLQALSYKSSRHRNVLLVRGLMGKIKASSDKKTFSSMELNDRLHWCMTISN
jgi:hypothetical protein